MKEGPFFDFVGAFFHRLNNLLGGFYGKLELIVVYKKKETEKKLPPDEAHRFLEALRRLKNSLHSPDAFETVKRSVFTTEDGPLGDFFLDRRGRCANSFKAAEGDADLRGRIEFFLTEAGKDLPEPPPDLGATDYRRLFEYAQKLVAFSQQSQVRWFDASDEKML